MPKKKFEDARYSSVKAVMMRDAAAVGRTAPRGERLAAEAAVEAVAPVPEVKPAPPAPRPAPRATPPVATRAAAELVQMPKQPAPASGRGKLTEGKMKRFRLTQEEDMQVEDALSSIRRRTRQTVNLSQVARVACELLVRLEDEIVEELERNPLPQIPSTQDTVAYAAYDEEVLRRLRRVYKRARQ